MSDRGRSPRRNQNGTVNHHQQSVAAATAAAASSVVEDRPSVSQTYPGNPVNSNNNSTPTGANSEFEETTATFSRRPSLDLSMVGPQGALAGILCAAHSSKQGGTLSAGNTLTRVGSKHTAVEYAVPHHMYHHHTTYIEYHHKQLSFSDDDSSSEPGYATGIGVFH